MHILFLNDISITSPCTVGPVRIGQLLYIHKVSKVNLATSKIPSILCGCRGLLINVPQVTAQNNSICLSLKNLCTTMYAEALK